METLLYTLIGLFFVGCIILTILYGVVCDRHRKTKNELSEISINLSKTEDRYSILLKSFNELKTDLIENKRIGYYNQSVTLMSENDRLNNKKGEIYKAIIYVTEVDKYTNGMSKIKMTNIEVVDGFSTSTYDWVKTTLKNKFSSIIETKDITWLESVDYIVTQRTKKIKEILENIKDK